jgi:hypothetical protein
MPLVAPERLSLLEKYEHNNEEIVVAGATPTEIAQVAKEL